MDLAAQEKWETFTQYKNAMFERTHTDYSPWIIVRGETREHARIQAMKHILSLVDYKDKSPKLVAPDSTYIFPWKREIETKNTPSKR